MGAYGRPWSVLCFLTSTSRVLSHSLIRGGRQIPFLVRNGATPPRGRMGGAFLTSSSRLAASAETAQPKGDDLISVLALHGSEGTADSITRSLESWDLVLPPLSVTAVNAPHPKGGGYCWWNMPTYVRSFNATEYSGFEQSSALVLDQMSIIAPDLVVGHSQGAILLSALLALQAIPAHPPLGYILNGVAWPNPYSAQLENLPSDSLSGVQVLLLVGEGDTINPPDQAARVASALSKAGAIVQAVKHPGGHKIPTPQQFPEALEKVRAWIQSNGPVERGTSRL